MSILSSTSGEFHFLDKEYNDVWFYDWNDIPQNFEFSHVIKFIPNIQAPPHSIQEHEEMSMWNDRITKLMEQERNARSN